MVLASGIKALSESQWSEYFDEPSPSPRRTPINELLLLGSLAPAMLTGERAVAYI